MKKETLKQEDVNTLVYSYLYNLKRVTTKKRIIKKILAPKYKVSCALTYLRKTKKFALLVSGTGIQRKVYWGVIYGVEQ